MVLTLAVKKNRNTNRKTHRQYLYWLVVGIMLGWLFFTGLIKPSLIWQKKERINVVVYGQDTVVFSFGLVDGVNYYLIFPPDYQFIVPGGYGYYRLGALGKLIFYEKQPEILRRTFSAILYAFIDGYFYNWGPAIYFGRQEVDKTLPDLKTIILGKSNLNWIDRFYILFLIVNRHNSLQKIAYLPVDKVDQDYRLDEKKLYDRFIGNFYYASYRQERVAVQIIYSKSKRNAEYISKIIEGQGIRVVDLSWEEGAVDKPCRVVSEAGIKTNSAKAIANYFGCKLEDGKTVPYDIRLYLGKVEENWSID